MLVDRMEVLRKVFANAGILIAAHCEEQSIISANTTAFKEKYGEDPDIKYHPQIRSAEACVYSSSLAIRLAKKTMPACTSCTSAPHKNWICLKTNP